MKIATIHSVCECQARLFADLGEQKQVLRGWATHRRERLAAPAHAMHATQDRFQVGWACPFCGRNTLRSFDSGGLSYREEPSSAA